MARVAYKLCFALVAAMAPMLEAACTDKNTCAECLSDYGWAGHKCFWCKIDGGCHHIYTSASSCAQASSDSCLSVNPLEDCDGRDVSACPAPGAHRSSFDTCDSGGAKAKRLAEPSANRSYSLEARMQIPGDEPFENETASNGGLADPQKASKKSLAALQLLTTRKQIAAVKVQEQHDGELPLSLLAGMSVWVHELTFEDHILSTPPDGWKVDKEWTDVNWWLKPMFAMYVNEGTKYAVLAIKGTAMARQDEHGNLRSIVGGEAPTGPLLKASFIVRDYQRDGYTVMVTGHSIGGFLAEVFATTFGLAGVGWCSPGPGLHNGFNGGAGSGFRNINFALDYVGNVFIHKHAQLPVYVEDYMPDVHHSKELMQRAMEARGDEWTNQNVLCKCDKKTIKGYFTKMEGVPQNLPSKVLDFTPLQLFAGIVSTMVACGLILAAAVVMAGRQRVKALGSDTQKPLLHA